MIATMNRIRDTHTDQNGNVSHRWALAVDGEVVAELLADIDTAEICWVWTHEDHRERGHATTTRTLIEDIADEAAAIAAAEKIVAERVVRRDELIRAALRTELPRAAIASAAGVKEARLYQIRDGRR